MSEDREVSFGCFTNLWLFFLVVMLCSSLEKIAAAIEALARTAK